MLGFSMRQSGFYYLDMEDEDELEPEIVANAASLTVSGDNLISMDTLKEELSNLSEDDWDWRVHQISNRLFSVVFPTKDMLQLSRVVGKMNLPNNDVSVQVGAPIDGEAANAFLEEGWVLIHNIPPKLTVKAVIKEFCKVLGVVVDAEEASIAARGPVRVKIWCRELAKVKGPF